MAPAIPKNASGCGRSPPALAAVWVRSPGPSVCLAHVITSFPPIILVEEAGPSLERGVHQSCE